MKGIRETNSDQFYKSYMQYWKGVGYTRIPKYMRGGRMKGEYKKQ